MAPKDAQPGGKKSREKKKHRGVYEKVPRSGI
jgi:hypothetical protein